MNYEQKRIEQYRQEQIKNKEVIIYKMNIQIIKKRLRELKQLSQNIKKGTQNQSDEEHNLNLIRIVIQKTRNISASSAHLKQNNLFGHHQRVDQPPQTHNNNKNKEKNVQNKHVDGVEHRSKQATRQKYISRLTKIESKSYEQQSSSEQQNQSHISRVNSSVKSRQSKRVNISIQQISHIIQQNKCMTEELLVKDQTIRALRQQIQVLNQEKEKMLSNHKPQEIEDQHTNFRCFKINLQANVFATSLCVDKNEYNRIEYDPNQLKLTLNSIQINQKINKRNSMVSSTSSNIRNSHQSKRNTTTKVTLNKNFQKDKQKFDLSDLQSVQYIDQNTMLMGFKVDDRERFLYVKFNKYQEMHEWDIGVFINYTILKSLGQQNIFSKNSPFINTTVKQNIEIPTKILQKQAQQKILIKYNKITKNKKIDRVQRQLILDYLRKQYEYKQIRKTIIENNLNSKFIIIDQSNRSSNGSRNDRKSSDANQVYHQILYNSGQANHEEVKNEQENKQKLTENKESKENKENKQMERLKQLEQMQREKQLKKQAQIQAKRQRKAKKNEQKRQKEQQIRKSIKFLKDGLFLTKYAEGALNPYKKRVYLSEDEQKLCWHNKGEKQKQSKYIQINQIKSVEIGQVGPGIQKHVQKNKIKNLNQFMVIKLDGKNRKILEFGELDNQKLVTTFAKNLNIFINSKKYSPDLSIDQQQSLILF